jgi:HD-like signal output (HDOD) protein
MKSTQSSDGANDELLTPAAALQALAQEVSSLFTLPDLVIRAMRVMDSPTASSDDLIEVIELDAGLAATVLKLANSALYGHLGRVKTLSHAVALIGHKALRDLVLATSAVQTFRDIPAEFVDMETFWDNSITCAVLARLIARYARLKDVETLFLGGLLHGVGRLVFYARRPVQYREVISLAHSEEISIAQAERKVFGFDFTDVGAALLHAWQLPPRLVVAVRDQATANTPADYEKDVAVIHLASCMAMRLAPCLKTAPPDERYCPDEQATQSMQALGLSPAALAEIDLEALAASLEVIEIIRPGSSTIF